VAHGRAHPELPLIGTLLGISLVALVGVWAVAAACGYLLAAVVLVGLVTDAIFGCRRSPC